MGMADSVHNIRIYWKPCGRIRLVRKMNQPMISQPPATTDLKTRLANLNADEVLDLKQAYHWYWLKDWLRANGWLNLVLGGLTVWLGLDYPRLTWISGLQIVAGLLIIGQSVGALRSPDLAGVLRFALVFLGAGLWNLGIGVTNSNLLLGLFGLFQIAQAYQTYRQYQRLQSLNLHYPLASTLHLYDQTCATVARGAFAQTRDGVQLWIRRNVWYGLLLDDLAVFGLKNRRLVIVRPKAEVNFVPQSSNPFSKQRVYGRLALNVDNERTMLRRADFSKYAQWKGEQVVLAQVTLSLWQRLPRVVRIIVWTILGLFLLYVAFMVFVVVQAFIQYG